MTYRVLLVDDNERIHHDFRSLLKQREQHDALDALSAEIFGTEPEPAAPVDLPSYDFDSAFQGHAALECVRSSMVEGRSYALAFVDVRMPPGWDGVETIQRIWELDPNIQMVICSAHADYTWEEILDQLGVTDKLLFLRKPFDPNVVKQLALSAVCKWSKEQAQRRRIGDLEGRVFEFQSKLRQLQLELDRLIVAFESAGTVPRQVESDAPVTDAVWEHTSRVAIDQITGLLAALSATELTDDQAQVLARAKAACDALRDSLDDPDSS